VNRRQLFAGAGAAALAAVVPVSPAALTEEQYVAALADLLRNSDWWAAQQKAMVNLMMYGDSTVSLEFQGLQPRFRYVERAAR